MASIWQAFGYKAQDEEVSWKKHPCQRKNVETNLLGHLILSWPFGYDQM